MAQSELKFYNLFRGGLSDSKYVTSVNSVPYMVGLDLRSEIGAILVNQNMKLLDDDGGDGSEVPDERPCKELTCTDGNVYHFSNESGKIWALSSSNIWSLVYTTSPVFGSDVILDAFEYSGYLYWSTERYLHRIRVNRTDDWATYAEPNWKRLFKDQPDLGFDADDIGYAAPTAVVEQSTYLREFKPIENELSGISVSVITKSDKDLTLTIHDPANNSVASVTVANADLVEGEVNFIKLDSPVAVDPDVTYHYHLTGSGLGIYVGVSASELQTTTVSIASPGVFTSAGHGLIAGDQIYLRTSGALPTGLSVDTIYYVISAGLTADEFEVSATRGGSAINTSGSQSGTHTLYAPSLADSYAEIWTKSTTLYHSFSEANGVMYLGDRNYIHQVEEDLTTGEHVFSYFALDVPRHFVISAIEGYNTALVIGTFSATDVNRCSAFWWNTYSTVSYSYEDEIEEQGIRAFMKRGDSLFCSAGVNGNIYQYVNGQLILYRQMRSGIGHNEELYVHLNASVTYKNALHFGLSAAAGDPAPGGMYSLFQAMPGYPYVFNIEYAISPRAAGTGELITSGVEILATTVRGNDLIQAWYRHDTGGCGVDIIDWDNKHDHAQFRCGVVKSNDDIYQFTLRQLIVDYIDLPGDSDIDITYYRNYGDTEQDPGTKKDTIRLQKILGTSDVVTAIEPVVTLVTDGNNAPKITGLYIALD